MPYEVKSIPENARMKPVAGASPTRAPVIPVMTSNAAEVSHVVKKNDPAVEMRIEAFLKQLQVAGDGPIPAFSYRGDRPVPPHCCVSCGEPLVAGTGSFGRCNMCGAAARQALERFKWRTCQRRARTCRRRPQGSESRT